MDAKVKRPLDHVVANHCIAGWRVAASTATNKHGAGELEGEQALSSESVGMSSQLALAAASH